MYKPITFLLKYIFKTAGKVEVQGREKLPKVDICCCMYTYKFYGCINVSYRDVSNSNSLHGQKELFEGNSKLVL